MKKRTITKIRFEGETYVAVKSPDEMVVCGNCDFYQVCFRGRMELIHGLCVRANKPHFHFERKDE